MNLPNDKVTIIGIDCATKLEKVGVAIADVSGKEWEDVCIKELFTGDKEGKPANHEWTPLAKYLADQIKGIDKVLFALDAPLGWPHKMRTALDCHEAGAPPCIDADHMFRRETDIYVKEHLNKTPFEVGASWLARTAHAALSLLQALREEVEKTSQKETPIPLAWAQGRPTEPSVIEVYPALALRELPQKANEFAGYKKRKTQKEDPGCDARRNIWKVLKSSLGASGQLKNDGSPGTDHEIDAVLCVLIAREFLRGECVPPTKLPPDKVALQEGWIWFPKGPLQGE